MPISLNKNLTNGSETVPLHKEIGKDLKGSSGRKHKLDPSNQGKVQLGLVVVGVRGRHCLHDGSA